MKNGNTLRFDHGTFRIMQIADVQENYPVSPDTKKLLRLAIEKEQPDLIVFTGDQIYGISPCYRIGNTEQKVSAVIDVITEAAEDNGIPFAVTFGNHDRQCGIPNEQQADIYAEKKEYYGGEYHSGTDKGTYRVPLYSGNGKHVFDLYLIDSNGQSPTGEYMPVTEKQLDWFRDEREKAAENGVYTPSLVFQHIPVPEYFDVLKRVPFYTKGAVEAFRTHKNEWYVLPDEIRRAGGFMLESPAIPDRNSGEFQVLKEKGNVLGLFVGHDHNNSFVAEKDGLSLVYTQCAGFHVYGPKRERGIRIIELNENDLSRFETRTVTFGQLTEDRLSDPVGEFILTHIPTSMEQVKRLAAAAGTVGIAGTAVVLTQLKKRGKK